MITTMRDLDDYIRGATLYGTGGGGSEVMGKNLLLGSFKEGSTIEWSSLEDLSDDDYVCTAFYMGSIAPLSDAEKAQMLALGLTEKKVERVLIAAVRELEKELQIKISGIIPVELGGLNSAAPVDAAMQMGIAVIDADLAGRAVPEVAQTLPRINAVPICPIACCDAWGNICIIKQTHSYDVAEMLGKMLSIPAFEPIGLACFAMTVAEAKNNVHLGSLSRSQDIGKAVREAREVGADPGLAFAKASGGKLVFRGKVTGHEWSSEGGYMIGTNTIEGGDEFSGKTLRIWFKNENHMSWLDGETYIMSPDLLQVVDAASGDPITNADISEGMLVSVVGIANELYQNEAGIHLLGPAHFGFSDIPYRPIQEIEDMA